MANQKDCEQIIMLSSYVKVSMSVVVCTYNRKQKLLRTLFSLIHQNYPEESYEIIVVDNAPVPNFYAASYISKLQKPSTLPKLKYYHHTPAGLSRARNYGIDRSKGDIICFIDDDAVALHDWLPKIAQAFDTNKDVGVVGGHIQLKIPSPRPKVLFSGFERYWSQLITDYSQYTEVETWDEFPWGANWCARKKCLLEIGGFNTNYGRSANNFWGGEELVAATLIQRLGYKIAICPQSVVIHDVDINRYTLKHLFRTFLASKLVRYKAKKDNYL